MLDRIAALLSGPGEVAVHPGEAAAFHAEEHADSIATAEERAAALRQDALDEVDAVRDALDALESVDHDIQTVTDVTTNVARERRRAIESFDPPEDIAAFHDALSGMVDDWGQVTQKEQMVLDRAGDAVGDVFSRIADVEERVDTIATFLDTGYEVLARQDRLESLQDRYTELSERRAELSDEIDAIDLGDLREKSEAVQRELDDLADDPRHDEMAALREDIADLEAERDALASRVSGAASDMDRGLKKLLYAARNGDVSLPGPHLDPLQAVRDGRLLGADAPAPDDLADALAAARDRVDQVDLSDRQVRKFESAADTLQDLGTIRTDIQELEQQIQEKRDDLDGFSLAAERDELEREQQRIESRIQDRAATRKRLREEKREVAAEIDGVVDEMAEVLDGAVRASVRVEPDGPTG